MYASERNITATVGSWCNVFNGYKEQIAVQAKTSMQSFQQLRTDCSATPLPETSEENQ